MHEVPGLIPRTTRKKKKGRRESVSHFRLLCARQYIDNEYWLISVIPAKRLRQKDYCEYEIRLHNK